MIVAVFAKANFEGECLGYRRQAVAAIDLGYCHIPMSAVSNGAACPRPCFAHRLMSQVIAAKADRRKTDPAPAQFGKEKMSDRIYLQHPTDDDSVGIPVGFSWMAFLLGPVWAFSRRLYLLGAAMILGAIPVAILSEALPPLGFLIGIGIAVLYGTKANEWHKLALLRKGYRVL